MHLYRSLIVKLYSSEKHAPNPLSLGKLSGKLGHFSGPFPPLENLFPRPLFARTASASYFAITAPIHCCFLSPLGQRTSTQRTDISSPIYFYFGRKTITKKLLVTLQSTTFKSHLFSKLLED